MGSLSELPNVGRVLENHLLRIGVLQPEQLREMGAERVFLLIRDQIDPEACLHMLYGIQGAIEGIPDKSLPPATKERLRAFHKSLPMNKPK